MKLINNLKIILLTLVTTLFVSCLKDEVIDFGEGPVVVQFINEELSSNFIQDGSDKVYDLEIPIKYIGLDNTSFSNDVTLTIAINTNKSTATEGTEFSLPKTTFTIPVGTNTAMVSLKVDSANLDALNPKVVALEIVDSSGSISEFKNTILITLQAICPSDLAGNWTYTNGRAATIVKNATGKYTVSSDDFLNYVTIVTTQGEKFPFDISDICGNLIMSKIYIQDTFFIPTSGSGTVIDSNTIELKYNVSGFPNRVMTLHRN